MKEELLKIASESLSSDEVSEIVKEKFMNALGGAIEDAFRWGDAKHAIEENLNGKHCSRYSSEECAKCENIQKHREYLLSQRKFAEGEQITSIEELLKQEWVMWYHSTKHIEVFKNMQLNLVLKFLKNGAFKKAIRKESEEK